MPELFCTEVCNVLCLSRNRTPQITAFSQYCDSNLNKNKWFSGKSCNPTLDCHFSVTYIENLNQSFAYIFNYTNQVNLFAILKLIVYNADFAVISISWI